jgi:threonine dehydrogenase-like Zn-dependent dehydrogenase
MGTQKNRNCQKDIPEIQKGYTLLKILYCGICGSDGVTFMYNQTFATYPRISGHEFSAEIVDIAENQCELKKEMIVTANSVFNCDRMLFLQERHCECCEHNKTIGIQRDDHSANTAI